jgi:hypothetical protein
MNDGERLSYFVFEKKKFNGTNCSIEMHICIDSQVIDL